MSSWLLESLRTLIDDLNAGNSGVTTLEAADSYKRRIELMYVEWGVTGRFPYADSAKLMFPEGFRMLTQHFQIMIALQISCVYNKARDYLIYG